jgi:hypothetical protein
MKHNSLMAIGFGFILLLCLPMFLADLEVRDISSEHNESSSAHNESSSEHIETRCEHKHEIKELPPLGGVKRFFIEVCMIDSSVVSHSGEHRDIPHIKEFLRSR